MRTFLRPTAVMSLAVFVAMSLASLVLLELTTDKTYLYVSVPLVALLMLISGVSRHFRIHSGLVHLWQLLALLGVVLGLAMSLNAEGGNPLTQLQHTLLDGILHVQTNQAPMPANDGATLLLVLLVGAVAIIADMLVLTLETPAWVAAPMLTLYLIPALSMRHPVHWWSFLLLGAAYLVVLAADTTTDLASWTRNLTDDDAERDTTAAGIWSMATLIGAPVLALALLAGNVLPTFGDLDLTSKRPKGVGPIQMQDPTIELHRNLAQQSDDVVLTYTTDNPQGQYLRLASLTDMQRDSWKLTAVQLQDGDLTPPPGLTGGEATERTKVKVRDFGSQYLPSPYAPQSFAAEGQWAFDPVSLMILSTSANNTDATRGLDYEVTSFTSSPDPTAFSNAKVGTPPDASLTTKVPDDVPQEITQLTAQVVRDAGTPVLKAAAIQAYLRDPRRFTYSTEAPSGDGFDVLKNFLTTDRKGYCIHFASSMALMARISGIPARVSVGFLPGTQKGQTWEVRGKEMHAWPELYFEDYGWVRFEPTAGVADAPAWTVVQSNNTDPSQSGGPSQSASPSSSASPSASAQQTEDPKSSETQTQVDVVDGDGGTKAFPWRQVLTVAGTIAGVTLLVLLPMLLRGVVRRRRFGLQGPAADQAEALWSELRDTVRDLGGRWPEGSPRQKAASLSGDMAEPSHHALSRIAEVMERARYSRGIQALPEDFVADVKHVRADLRVREPWGRKLVASLWPRSLFLNLFGK